MVSHENFGVPRRGNKDSIDTAGDGRGENVGDLKPDKECEQENDGGIASICVVGRVREDEIQVSEKRASIGDEEGAKGKYGTNEAFLEARLLNLNSSIEGNAKGQ